jgi:hypothetical protein
MEEEFFFRKFWGGMLRRAFGRKEAQRQMLPRNGQRWESEGERCFEKRAEILRYPLLIPPGQKVNGHKSTDLSLVHLFMTSN